MNYLAIDPGSKGFITLLKEDGTREFYSMLDGDTLDMAKFIRDAILRYSGNIMAVMEEVHSIFGSSSKATFSFGEINGYIKGVLTALNVPYTLIQPKKWQKAVWINQDLVYESKTDKDGKSRRQINTKQTSYNAARRLFPTVDLRRTDKCKNFDDNKVDSILIAEYARRNNL